MSCHDVAEALVDERLPRPPGLQAHLERCPECRALARLHASATLLGLPEPPPPAPISREAIFGVVRRRRRRRRIVVGTAATCALAALVLFAWPRLAPPVPLGDAPLSGVEHPVLVVQPERSTASEPASLGLLMAEVYGYTRGNPSVEDALYRPFGTLALWVRPPDASVAFLPSSRSQ